MKIKTADLTGAAFSWAIAQAEGRKDVVIRDGGVGIPGWRGGDYNGSPTWTTYAPWFNWAQGGPIIEREDIHLGSGRAFKLSPEKGRVVQTFLMEGETKLIAAMRCFVASRLGDEVEVPEELCS
jgi:hypothetical protein